MFFVYCYSTYEYDPKFIGIYSNVKHLKCQLALWTSKHLIKEAFFYYINLSFSIKKQGSKELPNILFGETFTLDSELSNISTSLNNIQIIDDDSDFYGSLWVYFLDLELKNVVIDSLFDPSIDFFKTMELSLNEYKEF
jgi:hypothetical protein